MLIFAHQPRRYWWAGLLGVLLSAFHLFSTEYFFGLELLRPVLLWLGLRTDWPERKDRSRRALLVYLPFFLVLLGFLYWRTFILGFYLYQPELVSDLGTSPVERIAGLPGAIWEQVRVATGGAWAQVFRWPDFSAYGPRLTLVYLFVLLLTGICLYLVVNRYKSTDKTSWGFSTQWIGLGVLSLLLAGIPFLVTDLPVRLTFPNSRFTLPFALGAALLLVAILELVQRWNTKILAASILAALAVGFQFNNGFLWREDWQGQESFFWQMLWRIPGLRPGSILISSDTPFAYSSDNSLTFPLNLMYAPENRSTRIDFAYFFASVRLGNEIKELKPGLPVHQDYLAATFDSSSDHLVAVHFAPPGCFRVLHPVYDKDLPLAPAMREDATLLKKTGLPVLPRTVAKAVPLSNLAQIIPDPLQEVSPPGILGPEPEYTWCYYFEKADLARQEERWEQVAEIGDQVFAIPYYPDDYSEYLPFVEAYARTGSWEDARDLTRKTADLMPVLRPALCAVWQRMETNQAATITPAQIEKMKAELGYCPYP
jgi:hypothetical protein